MVALDVLIQKWIDETSMFSNPATCVDNRHFDVLLKFDKEELIEKLFDFLQKDATIQVMVALKKLTGENPVLPFHKGNVSEMRRDWLDWYKNNGSVFQQDRSRIS